MALQSIVNEQAPLPEKSALQNAYKAFDLAKTLAGIYGTSQTIWGTNAPNIAELRGQPPMYGLGSTAQGQGYFQSSPLLSAYGAGLGR